MDYSLQDIPVFIINLPQSTDRKIFMRAQCENVGISPIFIDAVYGKDLSKSDIEKYCDQDTAKKLFGRELLLGEIGCALSHKKIYQKIVDEKIPYAIILEDDAVLEKEVSVVIKKITVSSLLWDLILLGHYKSNKAGLKSPISLWDKHRITSSFILGRLADFGYGAHGYMITLECAKKLLAELDKIHKPIDLYTPDSNIINVYALSPTVINVDNKFDTLIDENGIRSSNDRLSAALLKKIGIIDAAVSVKSFLRTLKTVKKYK